MQVKAKFRVLSKALWMVLLQQGPQSLQFIKLYCSYQSPGKSVLKESVRFTLWFFIVVVQ